MSICSFVRGAAAPAMVLWCAGSASAGTLIADASAGNLAARARFEAQAGNLVITLANTSAADVFVPADVLTGVYFNITGPAVSLSRVSVLIAAGSSAVNVVGQPAGGVVGGEFAYRQGLIGPRGASFGVSSSGLGLFGPADVFTGGNLAGPAEPNGLQYGLTSAGDNLMTHNGGTDTPLIQHAVVVTLSGLPEGFDPEARITGVNFQYGTALTEPNLLVPAPAALGLAGMGMAFAARRRRCVG